jgi:hypothetical protein
MSQPRDFFADPAPARPEPGPGPWFESMYDGQCSRGGEYFGAGATIRADGDGEWECQTCVEEDEGS